MFSMTPATAVFRHCGESAGVKPSSGGAIAGRRSARPRPAPSSPRVTLGNGGTDYSIGEVVGLAFIGGRSEVSAKVGAIEKCVLVVTTGCAYTVGAAGGRIKRSARAVADRRDVEPVVAWNQSDIQPGDVDSVFAKPKAAGYLSNARRVCGAAGNQSAGVPFGDASVDFPVRCGDDGILQVT